MNISYQNHMWTIIARNVDIKRVLSVIAEKAGIRVQFPPDAEKMVTLNRAGASIKVLLKNLLIGWNHVIIYSGANQKTAKVVEVIVFSKKKPQPVNQAQVRIANRIQSYEKQIESLRQKLSTVGEDSARGKSYSRRIKMMEKTIDRLNRRAY